MVKTRSKKQVKKSDTESDTDDNELEVIDNDIPVYSSSDDGVRANNINIKRPLTPKPRATKRRKIIKRSKSAHKPYARKFRIRHPKSPIDNEDSDDEDDDDDDEDEESLAKTAALDALVDELLAETHELSNQKTWDKHDAKWRVGLTRRQINGLEPQYNNLVDQVKKIPTIQDILLIDAPQTSKKIMLEKLLILNNTPQQCYPHYTLKTEIFKELAEFKDTNLTSQKYSEFDKLEKSLELEIGTQRNIDGQSLEKLPMKYRILGSDMPLQNKTEVYDKYKYYEMLDSCSETYAKYTNWLNCALRIPTQITSLPINITDGSAAINTFLYTVKSRLDEKLYGMKTAKEEILFSLNNMITNPMGKGMGIALVGPQGVGKTELAHALAEAVGLPFASIPMGGAAGASHLRGHGFTYTGSRPGAIVNALHSMKQLNGILFLDEIDKISKTEYGDEVSKLLLHIADTTQNHNFKDNYLGNNFSIDLSNLWFIYSLNYIDKLDRTLRDRLPIITVEGYTAKEKAEIAKQHLLPSVLKNVGMTKQDISFDEETLMYLIEITDKNYNHETKSGGKSGVRQLKHVIGDIVKKLNMLRSTTLDDGTAGNLNLTFKIEGFKLPFIIKKKHLTLLKVIDTKQKDTSHLHMYS